jgi:hypothetical protein
MSDGPICFLLPEPDWVLEALPTSIAGYWQWQGSAAQLTPYWGRYHWVLQTYLYLKDAGLQVVLRNTMPSRGVIITHFDCVDYGYRPTPEQYLVIMLVDREVPHPRARLHVLHNPLQRLPLGLRHRYMPPWPQIGLIPRDPVRGDRFETLGYFGYPHNLHADIIGESFQREIADLGLRMFVPPPAAWHDFSEVDCVMAVRNFGRDTTHLNKPSLKLLNAWLAEAPAILGHEAAYRSEGQPGSGYLEATTPTELLGAIRLLRDDPARRRALVDHGRMAVRNFAVDQTVQRWRRLLLQDVAVDFASRSGSPLVTVGRGAMAAVRERVLWRRPGWFE